MTVSETSMYSLVLVVLKELTTMPSIRFIMTSAPKSWYETK